MRELFKVSIVDDEAIISFVGGKAADEGRKRLGNMYVGASNANYSNYASRIKFTTDAKGAAKLSFMVTCAVWIPYENTHDDDDSSNDQYLVYDAGGNASHYVRPGETYSLQNSYKFAIVSEEQKDALVAWTSSHYADSYARANAALDESGYIAKNYPIKVTSAEGQVNNRGETLTKYDAQETAMISGECEVLLAPNTTYYIWLYSTFDQTFVVRPFAFTGYWDQGQVIVSLDGAYGPHWM